MSPVSKRITSKVVIDAARALRSEHGENPEYDRALYELCCDVIPVTSDDARAWLKVILFGDRDQQKCDLPGCTGFSCPYCGRCTAECPNCRCQREG